MNTQKRSESKHHSQKHTVDVGEDTNSTSDEWVECVADSDYLISSKYPYPLRRKNSSKLIALNDNGEGYVKCMLNGKNYYHHRLVAMQFIPNNDPENKTEIDHINHVRSDNHISNLRWVTHASNMRNTSSYNGKHFTILSEISDTAIRIHTYGRRHLDDYFYDENLGEFYHEESPGRYRVLTICTTKNNVEFIYMYDVNKEKFQLAVNKFKALYNVN